MFDTVSYLMGAASGGGGGGGGGSTIEILLNEQQYKTTSGGTFSYTKTVTIEKSGSYFVCVTGFATTVTVSINDVLQTLSFEVDANYTLWYVETLELQAGDVISIAVDSTGKSAVNAQVIKTA